MGTSLDILRASGLIVLTLRGNQIHALTRLGDLGLLARFGFPPARGREADHPH